MTKILLNHFIVIVLATLSTASFAQTDWETDTSKDGKINVKSRIVKLDDGTARIDYIVNSTGTFSKEKAETFLKKSANHKLFWENCKDSKQTKKLSDNSWVSYVYFDSPWPMPDSDCVHTYETKSEGGVTKIIGKTTPDAYEKKDVDRSPLFDTEFEIKQTDQSSTNVQLTVSFGSGSKAPKWLLNSWLPNGPIGIMERLIAQLEK